MIDAYHYINHWNDDELCKKWCNPAPADDSAPNPVVEANDKSCFRCAFNTQACEQLNAWMGGYESILKKMTPGNFNWFLHHMLFYHTRHIIAKQEEKASRVNNGDDVRMVMVKMMMICNYYVYTQCDLYEYIL